MSTIDIVSVELVTRLTGAAPGTIGTTLAAAPISNFDLEGDPDDNGVPGPHRFDLDTVIITTTVTGGADQVEFGFRRAWLAAFGHPNHGDPPPR